MSIMIINIITDVFCNLPLVVVSQLNMSQLDLHTEKKISVERFAPLPTRGRFVVLAEEG